MKIFDLFKKRKTDPDVERRKISTIEQELLDRCKNGHRINPRNDYSHCVGYQFTASGHNSIAIGINNRARTALIDKFEVSVEGE